MTVLDRIPLIALAGATIVTFICGLVMLISRFDTNRKDCPKRVFMIAAVMFFCASFSWFSALMFLLHPRIFLVLDSPLYLAMLYYEVLLYYFIFGITRAKEDEHFGTVHFVIPLFIVGSIFIGGFFVPYDARLTIIQSKGAVYGEYKLYALLMTSKAFTFFIYNIVYSLLSLWRIRCYQKVIPHYSADEGHSPVRWLYLLFFISLGTLPLVLLGSFLGKNPLFNTIVLVFPLTMAVLQTIVICYNVVVANFKIIEFEKATTSSNPVERAINEKLNKETFERYIRQKKPYLKADLHITDMATELLTNRAYLSAFINKEYGMNFSRYINRWRLKELTKLRANPDYADCSGLELVQKAGFRAIGGICVQKMKKIR